MNSAEPHLQLEAGDVHVWWIDLTRVTESGAVLSAEEHARSDRFRQSHDRRRWSAAHVALRQILSHYIASAPEALRLGTRAQGKPVLLDEPSLCFNLSHAGERAAVAVAWQREVGIDLEPLAGDPLGRQDLESLMASACTPEEADSIESLPPADRQRAFLTLWTLKEAYLKGIGVGLTVEPKMVEVLAGFSPSPNEIPHPQPLSQCAGRGERDVETVCLWRPITTSTNSPLRTAVGEGGRGVRASAGRGAVDSVAQAAAHWTLRLLNPGPEWVAALAVAGSQPAIIEHHWPLDSREF